MRFITGLRTAAVAGVLALLPGAAFAQAVGVGGFGGGHGGGFGGGGLPGIGVGAYAPGQGPVGARGFYGGNFDGFQRVIGPLWGGGWGGGYGGGGDNFAYGGSANVYNYNHYDNRRNDGGFYGGGGVFYGDDGYSRLYADRPADDDRGYRDGYRPHVRTGYAPVTVYRPSQHIIYLPDNNRPVSRKRARHEARD